MNVRMQRALPDGTIRDLTGEEYALLDRVQDALDVIDAADAELDRLGLTGYHIAEYGRLRRAAKAGAS